MSMLYIVGTPIGNLEDISLRALRILGEVDFILCEDTRVTKKLLNHYKINTPTISFHQHSNERKMNEIIKLLLKDKNLALVSDAGTPGISDPGGKIVARIMDLNKERDVSIKIESVPGPSAVTAALSISGIPTDKFIFLGFPPHKKGRQTFLHKIFDSIFPVVVYESKHRIIKFLEEIEKLNKEVVKFNKKLEEKKEIYKKDKEDKKNPVTSVVVCREISKMHETVYRGDLEDTIEKIKESKDDQKGEFTVIIGK